MILYSSDISLFESVLGLDFNRLAGEIGVDPDALRASQGPLPDHVSAAMERFAARIGPHAIDAIGAYLEDETWTVIDGDMHALSIAY